MLKKFFLNALSAFVGAWAAFMLVAIALVLFIIGLAASFANSGTERLKGGSILRITLSGEITEKEEMPQLNYATVLRGELDQPQSLSTLLAAIDKASSTSQIDAIYLECGGVSAAPATLNALREGLKNFKESGKRIFAYGDNLSMGDYFVATAADAIYLNPEGELNLQGINGTTIYFKDFLDKIGVEVEMVKVGTFKSAVEPYTSNEMSEPARMQLDTLYSQMWGYIVDKISERSKLKPSTINQMVDSCLFLKKAGDAKDLKLIDDCKYERQVWSEMAIYVGKDMEDLNYVSPEFVAGDQTENPKAKNQIAVLYAVGEIGEYPGAGINCKSLVPLIVQLAEDDNVKGLVLRVNSPGGSAFGSEQIGEALDYFKSQGKTLAVSMGGYAASGGYWISCGAEKIYADPLTVTGSIGIFGLVPNVQKLTDKVGIHPQLVGTNTSANFPSIFFPLTDTQKKALQEYVERGYDKFIDRVATGRKKTPEYIRSIAEGRVWSAIEAKKLGLVDELGELGDAIEWVADQQDLSNYNTVSYPQLEPSIFGMLPMQMQNNAEIKAIVERLKEESMDKKLLEFARWLLIQNHIQARAPYFEISL